MSAKITAEAVALNLAMNRGAHDEYSRILKCWYVNLACRIPGFGLRKGTGPIAVAVRGKLIVFHMTCLNGRPLNGHPVDEDIWAIAAMATNEWW
jgi:hypothetical protein